MARSLGVTLQWLALFGPLASANLHHFFVGTSGSSASIYSLEFDDQASSLEVKKKNSVKSLHPYLAFNYNKNSLYATGSGTREFYSYAVVDNATLDFERSIEVTDGCYGSNSYASHVVASPNWPYPVLSSSYPGPASCGTVLSITDDVSGTLRAASSSSLTYAAESGIHGIAFSPNSYFLYSADLAANAVWTHLIGPGTDVVSLRGKVDAPKKSGPSDLVVHNRGLVLYVLLQETNELAVYNLNPNSAAPTFEKTIQLLPNGASQNDYIATGLSQSSDGKYLWTANSPRYFDQPAYITVFSLDAVTGAIVSKLVTREANYGANFHTITSTPFAGDLAAVTYRPNGLVEIWKVFPATGSEEATAEVIASTEIKDGGCCAKGIWYD